MTEFTAIFARFEAPIWGDPGTLGEHLSFTLKYHLVAH